MMGSSYVCQRNGLVDMAIGLGRRLSLKDDTIHDAVLLMDRVMSTGVRVQRYDRNGLSNTFRSQPYSLVLPPLCFLK